MNKQGKALSFEDLRVTYDHRSDSIVLTSKDADLATDGWRVILNSHTPGERTLRSKLQEQGLIRIGETLPDYALYPKSNDYEWWNFPLGVTYGGEPIALDLLNNPHTLLVGKTGSGASVVQRSILHHVADYMGKWDVLGIDLKKIELKPYKALRALRENLTLVTDYEAAVEALRIKRDLMLDRLELLASQRRGDASDLVDHGEMRAQLILIDEAFELLDERSFGFLRSARHDLAMEAIDILTDIAARGGAVQMHLLLRTQRADLNLPKQLLANLTNRIIVGQIKAEAASELLGSRIESVEENSPGRGLVQSRRANSDGIVDMQFYHSYLADFYLE